jgi:hypothetical protein
MSSGGRSVASAFNFRPNEKLPAKTCRREPAGVSNPSGYTHGHAVISRSATAGPSHKHDNEPHRDQRVYAGNGYAETNIGHDALGLELDLSDGHCTSPRNSNPIGSRGRRGIVPGRMYKSVLREIRSRRGGTSDLLRATSEPPAGDHGFRSYRASASRLASA